jgi:hypothetical protein
MNESYLERLERKLGYLQGFEDGLKAAKYCSGCEFCGECESSPAGYVNCHLAKYTNNTVV